MKKLSFFLLLISFNAFSGDVSGTGIDSSNSSCYVIKVGSTGTDAKAVGDGSNIKTIVVCEKNIITI